MKKLICGMFFMLGLTHYGMAAQLNSNIEAIAQTQMAATSNNTLIGCDYAQAVMWGSVNEMLGVIPGIGTAFKFGLALSKMGNNTACRKLDGTPASTLDQMAAIADAAVDKALREQLTNEGDDLLAQLTDASALLEKYDQLSEQEKTLLAGRLDALGAAASQLEASGKSLGKEALKPLVVISGVKLAAYNAEYSILTGGLTKDLLTSRIRDEANKSIAIFDDFRTDIYKYVTDGYKAFYENYDVSIPGGLIPRRTRGINASVAFYGTVLWSDKYRCTYYVTNVSKCSSYGSAITSIKDEYAKQAIYQKIVIYNGYLGLDVAEARAKMGAYASAIAAKFYENRWIYLKNNSGYCFSTNGNYGNGGKVGFTTCDPSQQSQEWIFDSAGYLRSAEKSGFCLSLSSAVPVNDAAFSMQACDVNNAANQTFSIQSLDETLRLRAYSQFCVTAFGYGAIVWQCDQLDAKNVVKFYRFDNLVNRGKGKCLDNVDGQPELNTCVQGEAGQLWAFDKQGKVRSYLDLDVCLRYSSFNMSLGPCENTNPGLISVSFSRVKNGKDFEIHNWIGQCFDMSPLQGNSVNAGLGWPWFASCSGIPEQLWY